MDMASDKKGIAEGINPELAGSEFNNLEGFEVSVQKKLPEVPKAVKGEKANDGEKVFVSPEIISEAKKSAENSDTNQLNAETAALLKDLGLEKGANVDELVPKILNSDTFDPFAANEIYEELGQEGKQDASKSESPIALN